MRITYALAVYGQEEIDAVVEVLKTPLRIGPGECVKEFERAIAKLFGKPHGVMVNSGSSANLLAVEALELSRGSEVITPVLTFSTTIAPLLQQGLKPVFVDVLPGTYVIDADKIEAAITKKTRALMIPSLLGNIPDLEKIQKIAKKHKLSFIEDSCDTVGATFAGKPTGHYSDISTTSFYASHIITAAGSGGMVCVRDPKMAHRILVKSSWGRDSTLFGTYEKSEDITKRFAGRIGEQPYDAKFVFSEIGYNLQSGELNAAFGLEQLKRLKTFAARRQTNFKLHSRFFKHYEQFFVLPIQDPRAKTSWLAYPLTIRPGAPFTRMEITRYLEEHNIQTRPIFTGNILRQPAFSELSKSVKRDRFPVADDVMRNGFLIGCHHGFGDVEREYLEESVLSDFLRPYVS
ncbi:MAG TPA: aminotransferase class I/II-fold pyridoxal phosphate-dependent enzyme [Candidatus Paceibacterota bacterium]|nr:aminotransferase class I/II-fold pyridoxal phosphate-dependent enzyme [Candidatus Paceibacterota bacterium]